MSVDVTLLVIEDIGHHRELYRRELGFVEAAFSLARTSHEELWNELAAVDQPTVWDAIQLPLGAHCTFIDGRRPEHPDGDENGCLLHDHYGEALRSAPGRSLERFATRPGLNGKIFRFVSDVYADREVVIYWH